MIYNEHLTDVESPPLPPPLSRGHGLYEHSPLWQVTLRSRSSACSQRPCCEGGTIKLYNGRAVQVRPMKPTLKVPGTKRLQREYDKLLSILLSISSCAATQRAGVPAVRLRVVAVHAGRQARPGVTRMVTPPNLRSSGGEANGDGAVWSRSLS